MALTLEKNCVIICFIFKRFTHFSNQSNLIWYTVCSVIKRRVMQNIKHKVDLAEHDSIMLATNHVPGNVNPGKLKADWSRTKG